MNQSINTLDELLVHAHELEREAVERYEELAGQMEVHNQPELAELFHKMAAIEQQHVDKVESLAGSQPRPLAPWDYQWQTPESPESVPVGQGHYRMNPHQALTWFWPARSVPKPFSPSWPKAPAIRRYGKRLSSSRRRKNNTRSC